MEESYKRTELWKNAFELKNDGFDDVRNQLSLAYEKLRSRVALLVNHIQSDMPSLTVHDITHIDSLWTTASIIAGDNYPLNPAEAFVLGGAFLLHDAAHCVAAYPSGVAEIKTHSEWTKACARRGINAEALSEQSPEFREILFDTLRKLHPKQARNLLKIQWNGNYLLEHSDLREAYGHIIGEIAESHWLYPNELEKFKYKRITTPAVLHPASWEVNVLKIALLLRTSDAAHMDSQRAPQFLMALRRPQGESKVHWDFQKRMNKVECKKENHELYITSSPFNEQEQEAWWLAYDTAQMVDKELKAADRLIMEHLGRDLRLSARNFNSSLEPELFERNVPTDGWHPVDANIKITNIKKIVTGFGGRNLYGDDPKWALRELLQNAVDAIHAARSLGYLDPSEGSIKVELENSADEHWLHVIDTGIGMSKFVLTNVLLDFGKSLWSAGELDNEWNDLSAQNFHPIGQFGIGFFSVFMLGAEVTVTTRRTEPSTQEPPCWTLVFKKGSETRPLLRASEPHETLKKSGTKISVKISKNTLEKLCFSEVKYSLGSVSKKTKSLSATCAYLAPAIDIDLFFSEDRTPEKIVSANDWKSITDDKLLDRLNYTSLSSNHSKNLSLIENSSGEIIGRAAVTPNTSGIGVINGILAGAVDSIVGLINCKKQTDLARKTATPDITKLELTNFSEKQKDIQLLGKTENLKTNHTLIKFGATPDRMVILQNSKGRLTYEEITEIIKKLDHPLIIHHGNITFEDDDYISRNDFDSFELDDSIYLASESKITNWLTEIDPTLETDTSVKLNKIIISTAMDYHPDNLVITEEVVKVGEVFGNEITRRCFVIAKTESDIDEYLQKR